MLTRLLRMPVSEVTDRGRQQAAKWLDRNGVRPHRPLPPRLVDPIGDSATIGSSLRIPHKDQGAESEMPGLFDRFRTLGQERFFAGAMDPRTVSLMDARFPVTRESILASADAVCRGRFDLLGHVDLDFGDPVNWHLDAVSGRRSPVAHWSLIDPTNAKALGDCKVIWELSRHQSFVTLALAHRLSGDERYARTFATLFRSWMRANPPGMGINWASSLEAAFRIVSWCWAILLFGPSPSLSDELSSSITGSLEEHASHVERYLSTHSSPNTHLTGEALGLFYAGLFLPEHPDAERWRTRGQAILEEQVRVHVLQDGVYFEQTTAYQSYTVEIYLHYLILAARNGIEVSPAVPDGVIRLLDVLLALRRPDGSMPAIGDADGGSLLRLGPRAPDDPRGIFAIAAAWFRRADYAWAAGGLQPEAIWLLGSASMDTFDSLVPTPPLEGSRSFSAGGYVVMRSGFTDDAHHLIFDTGPLGCPMSGAHGHADLLSVQVSPFGAPCIVDPGTYTYSADPAFRDYFRSTAAHATIVVDGQGQAEPKGPFQWRQRPAATLGTFFSNPRFDLADASHKSYSRLPGDVLHRRRVLFMKSPAYWLIVDDLMGGGEHHVDLRFQFVPGDVRAVDDGWVVARSPEGKGLWMRTFAKKAPALRMAEGSLSPIEGWVSRDYGVVEPAPLLSCSLTTSLPCTLMTVLMPADGGAVPQIIPLTSDEGTPEGLIFGALAERIRFSADTFTIEGGD